MGRRERGALRRASLVRELVEATKDCEGMDDGRGECNE